MASTKERENFVYIAKLAEQAERYDGENFNLCVFSMLLIFHCVFFSSSVCFDFIAIYEDLGFFLI